MRKICLLLLTALLFCGCGIEKQSPKKLKSLDFTVLAPEEMPEELLNVLEEKKTSPFKVTYKDEGYLYICEGYGEQKSSGYSIAVKDLYLTENAVCMWIRNCWDREMRRRRKVLLPDRILC